MGGAGGPDGYLRGRGFQIAQRRCEPHGWSGCCFTGRHRSCTPRTPILSTDEAQPGSRRLQWLVARPRTSYTAKHRLGEVHAGELPVARVVAAHCLYPMLAPRCAAPDDGCSTMDSSSSDASRNATRPVPRRRLAINVALSDPGDFVGADLLEASREVISLPCGHAVCHASGVCRAAVSFS